MIAPGPQSLTSAVKTVSFTGAIATANALVTSLTTSTSPVSLTGAGFTGVLGVGPVVFTSPIARAVTVTTAAHTATYATGAGNAIVVTGLDSNGTAITDTLALTATNGGETLTTTKGFATITRIDIPAQNDSLGAWTFGVSDILVPYTRYILVGTAGTLHVKYSDGAVDTIPSLVVTAEPGQAINVNRIYSDSTSTNFTLYF